MRYLPNSAGIAYVIMTYADLTNLRVALSAFLKHEDVAFQRYISKNVQKHNSLIATFSLVHGHHQDTVLGRCAKVPTHQKNVENGYMRLNMFIEQYMNNLIAVGV
jgi:hypothetical protein